MRTFKFWKPLSWFRRFVGSSGQLKYVFRVYSLGNITGIMALYTRNKHILVKLSLKSLIGSLSRVAMWELERSRLFTQVYIYSKLCKVDFVQWFDIFKVDESFFYVWKRANLTWASNFIFQMVHLEDLLPSFTHAYFFVTDILFRFLLIVTEMTT